MKRLIYIAFVVLSFVLASLVSVYPLSFELARYRPMVLVLVLYFWAIYEPRYVGVGVAFLVGIVCDLLLDTHLGYQAFCAVASVFLIRLLSFYAKRVDLMRAWVLAIVALTLYRTLLWLFQSFAFASFVWVGFRGYVVSVLLFVPIWLLLYRLRCRLDHREYLS